MRKFAGYDDFFHHNLFIFFVIIIMTPVTEPIRSSPAAIAPAVRIVSFTVSPKDLFVYSSMASIL